MLYSQNMSAANFINQLDGVAQQAAMFAKRQNDQASAAALFGIGQDLSYAIQAFDQLRLQGQIDDARRCRALLMLSVRLVRPTIWLWRTLMLRRCVQQRLLLLVLVLGGGSKQD